jgi:hypothetical protein
MAGDRHLSEEVSTGDDLTIEAPIEHRDVTTIMGLLGDMQHDIRRVRELLEGELGEQESDSEDDA